MDLIGVYVLHRSQARGKREVYAVSEQWKETLWIVQVTRWNIPPPNYLRFCFYTLWYIQPKPKPSQQKTYPANHNLLFFGQLLWNEMRMLPKFWINPTRFFRHFLLHSKRMNHINVLFVCHFNIEFSQECNAIIIIMMMKWCQWNVQF